MLNAFCRVAPSLRLSFFAILAAAVFFFARLFSLRTSVADHARLLADFFFLCPHPFVIVFVLSARTGYLRNARIILLQSITRAKEKRHTY